jgi:hypothetical protein
VTSMHPSRCLSLRRVNYGEVCCHRGDEADGGRHRHRDGRVSPISLHTTSSSCRCALQLQSKTVDFFQNQAAQKF